MQREAATTSESTFDGPTLRVDFMWKKFKTRISEVNGDTLKPYMIVDCNMTKPHLEFKSEPNLSVIGTGSLHTFKIHPDYELRGHKGQLKALKRWQTRYTHLSHNFGTPSQPMTMTWTTSSNFVDWDFICLDESLEPVARFNSSWWAVKKLGNIEFLGDKAKDTAAREEVVVVGLTLFYCMLMRMNNIFNFFGAIFASTGSIEQRDNSKDSPHEAELVKASENQNGGKMD